MSEKVSKQLKLKLLNCLLLWVGRYGPEVSPTQGQKHIVCHCHPLWSVCQDPASGKCCSPKTFCFQHFQDIQVSRRINVGK